MCFDKGAGGSMLFGVTVISGGKLTDLGLEAAPQECACSCFFPQGGRETSLFTTCRWKKPVVERFLQAMNLKSLMIQVKCSLFRAKAARVSRHLPTLSGRGRLRIRKVRLNHILTALKHLFAQDRRKRGRTNENTSDIVSPHFGGVLATSVIRSKIKGFSAE